MLKYDGSLTGQRLEEEKPGEKQGQTVHKTVIFFKVYLGDSNRQH